MGVGGGDGYIRILADGAGLRPAYPPYYVCVLKNEGVFYQNLCAEYAEIGSGGLDLVIIDSTISAVTGAKVSPM